MSSMLRYLAWFTALASTTSCVAEALDTSSSAQDLSSIGIWSWGQLDGHLNLGPTSTQTCFLRGIHGSLKGVGPGTAVSEAGAVISAQNGNWDLYTFHGSGPGVSGQATCIPNTLNRVTLSNHYGPSSVPATANRQCFLTSVRSYGNSWSENLPSGSPPGVQLAIVNGNWILNETVVENDNPDGVIYGGHSEAVCVDIPATGLYGWVYGAGSSTLVETIVPAPANGWGCGLTGLHGVFLDTWDKPGVEAAPVSQSNSWTLTLAANKQGMVRCVY
jgi:hypothetical protein